MKKITACWVICFILFCSCKNENKRNQIIDEHTVIEKENSNIFVSGKYGDVTLIVSSDTVSGVYEYYNLWNSSISSYQQVNVFYFRGIHNQTKSLKIDWGWPDESFKSGELFMDDKNNLNLKLDSQPDGYTSVDFVGNEGYSHKIDNTVDWIDVNIIKSRKAYFYDTNFKRTKKYIVENDILKVLKKEKSWVYGEYKSFPKGTITKGWVRKIDLY